MRRLIHTGALVAPIVLLGACVSAPGYQEADVPVPATFAATATREPASVATIAPLPVAPVRARAGDSIGSALLTPRVSSFALGDRALAQLIAEAERANTDERVAEARLTSTRAARRLEAYDLAPTVTASGSAVRQQMSMAQIPGLSRQLPSQELWDVGLDASWELDLFGRVRRGVAAQSAFVESAEHSVDDVRVSVAADVAREYFELRGAQQQLAVAEHTAENQQRTVKLTEDRLAAGRGTGFDRERARAALFLTQATIPDLETRIAQHRLQIGVLLGRTPGSLPPALDDSGSLPPLPDTLDVGTPAELVRRRPDVLAAERQVAATSMLVSAAHAEYLPRLTLAARAGYAATTFDSLTRSGTSRILVGPVLSWPLFDLTRVREHVDLARAEEDQARAEHDAIVLRALAESDASLVAYERAHARLAVLQQAVDASAHAADLAQQRFEAGLTDLLQVLDAQRTLLDAENQLAEGHTAAATALVAVYRAAGGTWAAR